MVSGMIVVDEAKKEQLKKMVQPIAIVDGCTSAVHVAYACCDTAFIFPITPSSSMAETADLFEHQGRKNCFGQLLGIRQMQSEGGAAGAMHGGLVMGSCATTFTASQGLLLMIPNMYKIAGELMPCVMHVAARAVATQALSIFGDHSDIMAVRSCGWALLSSSTVQEAGDLALIAHIATYKTRVPFVHFFDGFRTSHELQKVKLLPYELIADMLPWDAIDEHRSRGLNPTRPIQIGTAQGPEILFQNVEAANQFYDVVPEIVQGVMDYFAEIVGRRYKLFQYYGHADADRVIVIMGAAINCVMETVDYLIQKGEKVGLVAIHLYRPWSLKHFMDAFPKSVTKIAVLDRTKESGALGEPLYLDTCASFQTTGRNATIIGGRYGLASKDFTPAMVISIYTELAKESPKRVFTVGINDDVTYLSLDYSKFRVSTVPQGTIECMFWGMGSDGTVGANKNVIKILGDATDLQVQGYFAYSAHKAGGITVSHLRFGKKEITSQYLIQQADYLAVHRDRYITQFKIPQYIKEGGTFVLNCRWTEEELETEIPGSVKRQIAEKNIKMYTIDAGNIAKVTGMGRRINSVLMTVFFKLSGVLPMDVAIGLFKEAIRKSYGRKGEHVVEMNHRAVDAACDAVNCIRYDKSKWLNAPIEKVAERKDDAPSFVTSVLMAVEKMEGDDIPVSTVMPHVGGVIPLGTAAYEKRGIALNIPIVDMDKCTQCNYCAFVCPHAAIRPFLITEDEAEEAPEGFIMKKAKGNPDIAAFRYRIQVAPQDCTGCTLCAIACPDDALTMVPYEDYVHKEEPNWEFGIKLDPRGDLIGTQARHTLKGSQFQTPLLEFSGACEGCGETPYVKLLTQLFGERMVIANATGCTSIWGASYPSTPYTVNKDGHGPAWGNSLFEDNAEYGFGMVVAHNHRRDLLHEQAETLLQDESVKISDELREKLQSWVDNWKDGDISHQLFAQLPPLLEKEKDAHLSLQRLYTQKDMIPKLSQWMVGGDGWAYDIGYGGLDHVLASGENVNIMVLDTEVYSNTGGQISKATPMGAVHKFGMGGHLRNKKDLGMMAMEYGNVYVASCSELANMSQTVRAVLEAEAFDGPSLLLCYAPCIEHQYIKPFSLQQLHCRMAVDSGYWPLYRNDPSKLKTKENPFQLDSKKLRGDIKELLHKENRFEVLWRDNPQLAEHVEEELSKWCHERFDKLKFRAEGYNLPGAKSAFGAMQANVDESKIEVLYGSETGNTEEVARRICAMLKERSLPCSMTEFVDLDVEDVAEMKQVVMLCCTQGQGEFPENAKKFWQALSKADLPKDTMANVSYAVFGLGDSSYIYFNQAAKNLDKRFEELGAKRLLNCGEGDDQHPDKYDAALGDWLPDYFTEIKAPEPKQSEFPNPPMFQATPLTTGTYVQCKPQGAHFVEMTVNKRMTPSDYEVDIRHVEFNLTGSSYKYQLGDSMQIWPHNTPALVDELCSHLGYNPDQWLKFEKAGEEGSVKHELLLKNAMTVRQVLTECLDIAGRPTRRFYEVLWKHCKDPEEKKKAGAILEKANKEKLDHMTSKMMVNMFDMMKMYPSAKPSIEELIDLIPLIRPRAYSIASSQKFVGDNALHLCIGIVDWKNDKNEMRYGCATGYLRRLTVGEGHPKLFVATALKPTAFNMPPSNMNPMIMAGMGTGLAPFRSFIQHRAWLKRNGKSVGPTVLYFGCRYQAKDFLYGDELKAFAEEGVITELKTAFSRDQKEKFYVQHAIDNDPELLYKRLVKETGYFYLCGTAKQVPIDVRAAVERCISKAEGCTIAEAAEKVTSMLIKGQYNMEAW